MENGQLKQRLKRQSALQKLSDQELDQLIEILEVEEYPINEIIIEEGEKSDEAYLILDGEVSILKWGKKHLNLIPLETIKKDDIVGEMSFMDSSPRSTTVKTTKPTTICKLSREKLANLPPNKGHIYSQILLNIGLVSIERLRNSNQSQVDHLRISVSKLGITNDIGHFLIFFITSIVFGHLVLRQGIFLLTPLSTIPSIFQELITWLVLLIPTVFFLKQYQLTVKDLQINFELPPKTIMTIVVTILFGGLLILLAGQLIHFLELSPPETLNSPTLSLPWIAGYAIYCLAKELLARGVLLSCIQSFFKDRAGNYAVITTSLILNTLLLPFSLINSLLMFCADTFLGSFYLKQKKSYFAVVAIHFILGLLVYYQNIFVFY